MRTLIKSRHDFLFEQVSVFISGLSNPYNKFSREEHLQGFSFRKESVSFRTPFSSAECEVCVYEGANSFDKNSIIVIEVPFESVVGKQICVASVTDGEGDEIVFDLPPAKYSLFFEAFSCNGASDPDELQIINLYFKKNEEARFAILKNMDFVEVPAEFHIDGSPA